MDTFVFGPSADPVPQSQRFANEIAPVVRERVAQQRRQLAGQSVYLGEQM
jgi:hypothetical protein